MRVTFVIDERGSLNAQKTIGDLPTDRSMEVVIQKHVKRRTSGQNRYQWAAVLGDISRQVRIGDKAFTSQIWHEHLKTLFMPDVPSEELTLPNYKKWTEMPDGTLKMTASTKDLTTKGMSIYMEELFAYAVTELGVRFTTNE